MCTDTTNNLPGFKQAITNSLFCKERAASTSFSRPPTPAVLIHFLHILTATSFKAPPYSNLSVLYRRWWGVLFISVIIPGSRFWADVNILGSFPSARRSNYERTKRISTIQRRTPWPHVNQTINNTFHSASASSFSSIPLQLWSKLKQRKCTTEEISSKGWQRKLPLDWWKTHILAHRETIIDAIADRCCLPCDQNCFGKQCHQPELLPHLFGWWDENHIPVSYSNRTVTIVCLYLSFKEGKIVSFFLPNALFRGESSHNSAPPCPCPKTNSFDFRELLCTLWSKGSFLLEWV